MALAKAVAIVARVGEGGGAPATLLITSDQAGGGRLVP